MPASRHVGPLSAFLKTRDPESVPCEGCMACCHHSRIDVTEDEVRRLDLNAERDAEGWHLVVRDGACGYLGPQGCTIYDRRPETCRNYDCRVFSALGMTITYNNGQAAPQWTFDIPTEPDALLGIALQLGAKRALLDVPNDVKRAIREATKGQLRRNVRRARKLLRQANYSAEELSRLMQDAIVQG